jgi:hypothetical protein
MNDFGQKEVFGFLSSISDREISENDSGILRDMKSD